jgi:methionyl-tRNA formyltransferase
VRAFVVSDNRRLLTGLRLLLTDAPAVSVSYFCSEASRSQFQQEMSSGAISVVNVRRDVDRLREYDLGLSLHCKQIFPAELVEAVRCVNVHPGLNPHNRGWYPHIFSILNNKPAGVTIHEMDAEIDHGPIICQRRVAIDSWDTSLSVYERLLEAELQLLAEWLPAVLSGDYAARPPECDGEYHNREVFSRLCEIDLDKTTTFGEAIDFLRAMSHPPYYNAYFHHGSKRVWVRLETKVDEDE